ncbi:MAG TPA: site-specific integrase [Candidatus Baltobacteraceae bacterium]|jgi:integrase|nr:site-specific integrase [Candidatus Baltobacteraceae bacterium]
MSKTNRRAKGEGSTYRRPDGLWVHAATIGRDKEGKRIRRVFYGASRTEVLAKVADERARSNGSLKPPSNLTMGAWVTNTWLPEVKESRSASTHAFYDNAWRIHAAPILANVRLTKMDTEHVEALYAAMRRKGASNDMIVKVGKAMGRAISVAITRRKYHFSNPFSVVTKPSHKARVRHALTAQEAQRFLEAAKGNRYEALWVLLLSSGLRLGEALALRWDKVDLTHGAVTVEDSLHEVDGTSRIGPLKTQSSKRRVDLGQLAIDALKRHQSQSDLTSPFVFVAANGGHPKRSNLRQRHFQPICEKAEIDDLTIHGLRHSMSSLAMEKGISPKVIAERLGHTTVRMTLDRYSHVAPTLQREATRILDGVLSGQ